MPLVHDRCLRSGDTCCFPKLTVSLPPPVPRALLQWDLAPLPWWDSVFCWCCFSPRTRGGPYDCFDQPSSVSDTATVQIEPLASPEASSPRLLECLPLGCSLWKHLHYEKPEHREWPHRGSGWHLSYQATGRINTRCVRAPSWVPSMGEPAGCSSPSKPQDPRAKLNCCLKN